MVTQALARRQNVLGRSLLRRDLPATCAVQSVASNGAATTVATVRCRVVYPAAGQGQVYPDDQRTVRVLVPADTADPPNPGRIVVDGAAAYRIDHAPKARADDLLRAVECVEAR